jgi:hypothetical protein
MEVLVVAAKSDQGTQHIADLVRPHLDELSRFLSGEYGGSMEHLWIDLELCPADADRRDPFSFRFQKKVSPPRELKALGAKAHFHVGHFSVRPDYFELARVPMSAVYCHLARLIYEATKTLQNRKQIGDFDVSLFRARFAALLEAAGCTANESPLDVRQSKS